MKTRKLLAILSLLCVPVVALAQETQPTETVVLRSVTHRYSDPRPCDNPILVETFSRSGASTKDELTEVCLADLKIPPEWEIRVMRIIGNPLGPDVNIGAIVKADGQTRPMFSCKALDQRCWAHLKMAVWEMTARPVVAFAIPRFNAATRYIDPPLLADEMDHTIIPAWCRDVVAEEIRQHDSFIGNLDVNRFFVCVRDLQLPPKWLLTVSYNQRRTGHFSNWRAVLHPPKGKAILLDTVTLREDGFTEEAWRWITLQAQLYYATRHISIVPAEAYITRE